MPLKSPQTPSCWTAGREGEGGLSPDHLQTSPTPVAHHLPILWAQSRAEVISDLTCISVRMTSMGWQRRVETEAEMEPAARCFQLSGLADEEEGEERAIAGRFLRGRSRSVGTFVPHNILGCFEGPGRGRGSLGVGQGKWHNRGLAQQPNDPIPVLSIVSQASPDAPKR